MDRKGRPPNLQLQEKSQSFESQPKMVKGMRGKKGKEWRDFKEWKAVSHSVSILFNGEEDFLLLTGYCCYIVYVP